MFKLGGSPFTPEDFKEGTDLALVASAIEYLNSTEHRKIDRYSDSKELLSEYEAHHAHFLLSYATGLHSYRKGGCHYNLQYTDSGCHLVSTKVTMSMVAKEDLVDLKLYYDWLMNESPWADAFLSKTYHEDYPWLFLRTDIPSNFLASACIASRQTWENGSRFTLWRSLVNKGLDKSYAFFLMCSFGYGGFYTGSLGHCPLFPFALQRTQALSFARKQYLRDKRKARPLYVNNTVYSSDYVKVYDVFRDESNEFTSDLFDKLAVTSRHSQSDHAGGLHLSTSFSRKNAG